MWIVLLHKIQHLQIFKQCCSTRTNTSKYSSNVVSQEPTSTKQCQESLNEQGICLHEDMKIQRHGGMLGLKYAHFTPYNITIYTVYSYTFNPFHTILPQFPCNTHLTLCGWLSLVCLAVQWLEMTLPWFYNDGFSKFICCRDPLPKFFISQLS